MFSNQDPSEIQNQADTRANLSYTSNTCILQNTVRPETLLKKKKDSGHIFQQNTSKFYKEQLLHEYLFSLVHTYIFI
jgi:hypothetical protein